jgi:tetratricopeptide (TPR) repeat protein
VKAGIDAWQRADYLSATRIWRPLAEAGDANAQFNLGQAYRLGRGVQLDLNAAKTWFERAADSGHVDAQTTLGLLYYQNGEREQGLKWLKRAADQGEARALLVYGTALFNGDGVAQDRVLGYAYVNRAASEGLAPAQDTLDQLDELLPLTDRQRGLALARSIPTGSPVASKPQSPPPDVTPKPMQVSEAKPRPPRPAMLPAPASGGWRVQLGAFAQRGAAEALYQRVSGKAALAGRSPYYVASGSVTRLQVGPFASKDAAAAACGAIGVPCFPVAAR